MARDLLSNLSDYDLVYDEQDVRGHEAYGTDGTTLGTIRDMIADTDAGRVVALVLDNGQEIDADLVEIGDDRVVVHTTQTITDARTAGTPRVYSGYEGDQLRRRATDDLRARGIIDTGHDHVVSTEGDTSGRPISDTQATATHAPSGTDAGAYAGMSPIMGSSSNPMGAEHFDGYTEADDTYFREVHRDLLQRDDYDAYAPAYRAGSDYGRRADWHGRDWDALEPDMRRDYETHFGEGAWDRFKDSVQHGFQRTRNAVTGGEDSNRDTPY